MHSNDVTLRKTVLVFSPSLVLMPERYIMVEVGPSNGGTANLLLTVAGSCALAYQLLLCTQPTSSDVIGHVETTYHLYLGAFSNRNPTLSTNELEHVTLSVNNHLDYKTVTECYVY